MANLEKRAERGLLPLAVLGALGAGGYYTGKTALEDYNWLSPFRSPLKTKTFSTAKLKELSKDPKTYLTMLALLGTGYGAYKLGKGRERKDMLPDPELAELLGGGYGSLI